MKRAFHGSTMRLRVGVACAAVLSFLALNLWAVLVCLLALLPATLKAQTNYTDPNYLFEIPFGSESHWLQPWRSYLETVPASTFLNGTGVGFNILPYQRPDLVAQMLASHGIRHARVEVGWNSLQYTDDTQLIDPVSLQTRLLALKNHGIRPLILLNANEGAPCPNLTFALYLAADGHQGDTTLQLADASHVVVNYSGLSGIGSDV
ncbi:MAG TPA: hypothetical protein VKU00_28245, partial [Chthonomonadaceae bacterium]|nr:hypothetical protein [Chthonomonadaceae bacterium]